MPAGRLKGSTSKHICINLKDGFRTVRVGELLYVRDPECAWRKKYVTVTKVGYKVMDTDHGNLSFATDGSVRNSVHNYEIWSSSDVAKAHDLYNSLDDETKNKWNYFKDFFNLEGNLEKETLDKLFEVMNGTT